MAEKRKRRTYVESQVAQRLKGFREKKKMTQEEAAKAVLINVSTLSRLETGNAKPRAVTARALLDLYGCSQHEKDSTLELLSRASPEGYTDSYRGAVLQPLEMNRDTEAAAAKIRVYSLSIPHALLQTRSVAEKIIDQAKDLSKERRRHLVDFRMDRQKIFTREDPPICEFVVNEAALRLNFGSPRVTQEQLTHLIELNSLPNVQVRYWPFSAGFHEWLETAFTVFDPNDDLDPRVVYLENASAGTYLDTEKEATIYVAKFGDMFRRAVPIEEYRP